MTGTEAQPSGDCRRPARRPRSPTPPCATAATRWRHQFTEEQVRATVHALDGAGVEVIEVSHGDGLGGSLVQLRLLAGRRDRPDRGRGRRGHAGQDRRPARPGHRHHGRPAAAPARPAPRWPGSRPTAPRPTSRSSTSALARELGMETVGFLMMAHRTSPEELARQARIMVDAGAECVYVVDSAGALVLDDAQARVEALVAEVGERGPGRLPRPPEPVARRGQLGARRTRPAPGRSTARCARSARARATRPPRCWPPTFDHLGIETGVDVRRRAGRRRGGRPAVPAPLAEDGPHRDRAGLGRGLLLVPAARRTRGRAVRRARPRDPAAKVGEAGYVGGQEDMIIDIALQLAEEQQLGDLAAVGVR